MHESQGCLGIATFRLNEETHGAIGLVPLEELRHCHDIVLANRSAGGCPIRKTWKSKLFIEFGEDTLCLLRENRRGAGRRSTLGRSLGNLGHGNEGTTTQLTKWKERASKIAPLTLCACSNYAHKVNRRKLGVLHSLLLLVAAVSLQASSIKLKKDLPSYGSDGQSMLSIPAGTEIDVSDSTDTKGMLSVVYTNAEGELTSTHCKATDLGRKAAPPTTNPAAEKPSAPPPPSEPSTAPSEAPTASDEEGWTTSFSQALRDADYQHRMILMDFTGSDWCGWCIKLDEEVFSQQEFKDYAKANVILFKADFPKQKVLPEELQKQNKELATKYQINGYPTILLVDTKGKPVGKLGYMEGGPKAFIAELEKIKRHVW